MSYILLTWILAPVWWPIALFRRLRKRQPERMVIFEIAGIGDVVCSAHLMHQLRQAYPNAQIDLVIDPVARTLAPALTMVDHVIAFPYAKQRGLFGRLQLMRLCLGYDTAICLIPSAAQISGFCLAAVPRRLSVLPLPLNASYSLLAPLLTEYAAHQPGTYFLETQAKLFSALGLLHIDSSKQIEISIGRTQTQEQVEGVRRIGLLVGSGRTLKRVPVSTLSALAAKLVRGSSEYPAQILLIGGSNDQDLAAQIKAGVPEPMRDQVQNIAGQYALADLPAMLQELDLLIGVDSGVTHMADALGLRVLCIAGPVDLGEVYAPATARRQFILTPLPCYPCSRVFDTPSTCHEGTVACLKTLDADAIAFQAKHLLETPLSEGHK